MSLFLHSGIFLVTGRYLLVKVKLTKTLVITSVPKVILCLSLGIRLSRAIWEHNLAATSISKAERGSYKGSCITGHPGTPLFCMVAVTLKGSSREASLRMRLCWEVVDWMDNYEQTIFTGKYLRPGRTMQLTKPSLTFTSISLFDHSPELWDKRQNASHVTHLSGRRRGMTALLIFLHSTSYLKREGNLISLLRIVPPDLKLKTGRVCADQMFSRSSQDLWVRTSLGQKWNHIRTPN